jgi:hypothetical protein
MYSVQDEDKAVTEEDFEISEFNANVRQEEQN